MKRISAVTPAMNDRSRSQMTSLEQDEGDADAHDEQEGRLRELARTSGRNCQATACTMARTFRRVRDVLNRAYSAATNTTIRVKSDCSSATWMVDASSPVMPAFAAVSCGSVPVADDARPKPYTTTKTYGTRNRKIRKAMAAARTGPPAAVSRWTETNATSIERCWGRAASSWSTSSSPLARAVATVSFSLCQARERLGGHDTGRRVVPEAAAGRGWAARWGVVGWSRHRRGDRPPMGCTLGAADSERRRHPGDGDPQPKSLGDAPPQPREPVVGGVRRRRHVHDHHPPGPQRRPRPPAEPADRLLPRVPRRRPGPRVRRLPGRPGRPRAAGRLRRAARGRARRRHRGHRHLLRRRPPTTGWAGRCRPRRCGPSPCTPRRGAWAWATPCSTPASSGPSVGAAASCASTPRPSWPPPCGCTRPPASCGSASTTSTWPPASRAPTIPLVITGLRPRARRRPRRRLTPDVQPPAEQRGSAGGSAGGVGSTPSAGEDSAPRR